MSGGKDRCLSVRSRSRSVESFRYEYRMTSCWVTKCLSGEGSLPHDMSGLLLNKPFHMGDSGRGIVIEVVPYLKREHGGGEN